jgi:hypothetical protein
VRTALDAVAPPPNFPAPSAHVYAAGDIYPRDARERALCEKASRPDWLYMGALLVGDAGAIYLNSFQLKYTTSPVLRTAGPALIGITWGATVGGMYLAMPQCSPEWVVSPPIEGGIRSDAPLAVALALLGGATAPVIMAIATGPLPLEWSTSERQMRLVTAGFLGFGSAFLPYIIPPTTWAAAKKLEHLRAYGDGQAAFIGWSGSF